MINFMRMLGGAIGVSLCGILLEWRLAAHGDSLTTLATSSARLMPSMKCFAWLPDLCGGDHCCMAVARAGHASATFDGLKISQQLPV